MTVSEKVIELLNQDEQAKKLHTMFNEAAEKQGLTGEQYASAKQTFLMMLISKNEKAVELMAREAYEELRK